MVIISWVTVCPSSSRPERTVVSPASQKVASLDQCTVTTEPKFATVTTVSKVTTTVAREPSKVPSAPPNGAITSTVGTVT